MKTLTLLFIFVLSAVSRADDLTDINCFLGDRWGDNKMQLRTIPSSPEQGPTQVLYYEQHAVVYVEAIVRKGRKAGQLVATLKLDDRIQVTSTIYKPRGDDLATLDYNSGWRVFCKSK